MTDKGGNVTAMSNRMSGEMSEQDFPNFSDPVMMTIEQGHGVMLAVPANDKTKVGVYVAKGHTYEDGFLGAEMDPEVALDVGLGLVSLARKVQSGDL